MWGGHPSLETGVRNGPVLLETRQDRSQGTPVQPYRSFNNWGAHLTGADFTGVPSRLETFTGFI